MNLRSHTIYGLHRPSSGTMEGQAWVPRIFLFLVPHSLRVQLGPCMSTVRDFWQSGREVQFQAAQRSTQRTRPQLGLYVKRRQELKLWGDLQWGMLEGQGTPRRWLNWAALKGGMGEGRLETPRRTSPPCAPYPIRQGIHDTASHRLHSQSAPNSQNPS